MSSFFPWMGGKSAVAGRLAKILPDHRCYVEVFAGAANLLFVKDKTKVEVVNDINGELINLFRIAKHHRRELIRELSLISHSRKTFEDYRYQRGLTDIQKAARSWFLMKSCFGGKFGTPNFCYGYGTTGRARFNRRIFQALNRCHKRLSGVYVENLNFQDCIKRYDRKHTLFYCDPPYFATHGYAVDFGLNEQQYLAESLRKIRGKFLLSINNHPEIKRLYKGLCIRKLPVRYTISRKKTKKKATARTELLVANYRLPNKV